MEKIYHPKQIEQKWAKTWETRGYFTPNNTGEPYCIVIPPPNVTGYLHMGHGFQQTIMDVLTRYHRMKGCDTLWQVGLDHAGIATQMVVTQKLKTQNIDPSHLTREQFVQAVFAWKEQSKNKINQQMRRLGISVDWTRERFTLDPGLSAAVNKVFIELYKEGLIYRGKRLVNWDPVLNTAISDLEVTNIEQDGSLWYINYPIENSDDHLTVATTRPETMLGDTAVAVHPEDERYKHLIGKNVVLPLTEKQIPIIADKYVEQEFGTGCVKITPAHDFNDYEIGKRHDLPLINVLTPKAVLNNNVPKHYQGLDRFAARKQIILDLEKGCFLEKIEPYKLKVPIGDRSGAILEPLLTDQWFVKTKPLAAKAIEVVEKGEIKFVPETWTKVYLQWLYNIEDWCISRQLIWGHRIPAWYDEKDNIYVGSDEETIRKEYNLENNIGLKQDEDVLDTWFSSALWPFSTLGWPKKTEELQKFYPTNVLVTGFDIIFFWVARMVMMGVKFTGKVPFKEVYITGLIRDQDGQKMSKSKGNVLDPIDLVDGITLDKLIEQRTANLMQPQLQKKIIAATKKEFPEGINPHGMDALRFTFCALASPGRNINFDIQRLTGYRNFCNKIWNASRFVLMNYKKKETKNITSIADKWILSRLQSAIKQTHNHIEAYRFDLLAQTLYEFIWHEYCDWYLELYKAEQAGSDTIILALENILRLIHPITPFISEEIWQQIVPLTNKNGDSIMLQPFPVYDERLSNPDIEQEIELAKKIIIGVRNIRGEMNISPKQPLKIILNKCSPKIKKQIENSMPYLRKLANISNIAWLAPDEKPPVSATFLVEELETYVPMTGIIDIATEIKRLEKKITKLEKEIKFSEGKLSNKNYAEKAPKNIVEEERNKLERNRAALVRLNQSLNLLK